MTVIKGIQVKKPARKTPRLITFEEMIATLGPPPGVPEGGDVFAEAADACAAVRITDGKYVPSNSKVDVVYGGTVTDTNVNDLKVVAYNGVVGGVRAEGGGSAVTVDGAVINLSGDGRGLGGVASGASVNDRGSLTLKNAHITTFGKHRCATSAEEYSTLRVYDSVLTSHGSPYGEGYPAPEGFMQSPPEALEIQGNCRTHCTLSNSFSYFYNSTIICDGWAALSTDGAEGFVYLEANDCRVIATKSGYGAYSDGFCHDYFNRCDFDVACMAGIIAGESDMTFTDCTADCGTYFAMLHCVMGQTAEASTLRVKDSSINTKSAVVKVKSQNAVIDLRNTDVKTESGILVHTIVNDDPDATQVNGETVYGVHLNLDGMDVAGDILHEDTERDMFIDCRATTLKGAIRNAGLTMDIGSKWIATNDSTVTFAGDIHLTQLDAPKGVTITAKGAESGSYDLPGGGMLIVNA